jgi:hypothetical protein
VPLLFAIAVVLLGIAILSPGTRVAALVASGAAPVYVPVPHPVDDSAK